MQDDVSRLVGIDGLVVTGVVELGEPLVAAGASGSLSESPAGASFLDFST